MLYVNHLIGSDQKIFGAPCNVTTLASWYGQNNNTAFALCWRNP